MGIYSSKLICKQIQPLLDEWIFLLALGGIALLVCELLAFTEVLRLSAKPILIMPEENICDNFAAWNTAQPSSFQLQVCFLEGFCKLVFLGDIHRYDCSDTSLFVLHSVLSLQEYSESPPEVCQYTSVHLELPNSGKSRN